ncbi:MAG: DUF6502 family protein [Betaproteobacteria bacterium]|nr:DUF6502 family protein [Betaproteobacteria bacterium]MDH5351061.1 DUF6502 family protein [Betaproteobacteria bacterium]
MLAAALRRLLGPLVRVLLRNGFSYKAFSDVARAVFVEVGMRDFGIPGKKQTVSRVAVLTGLSRKEVQRILAARARTGEGGEQRERYNRAARVIAGWVRDREFADNQGEPAALAAEGPGASFAALVRRHSGDVPSRAVLDELLRVGAVQRQEDGRIRLRERAYVPSGSELDKLDILGADAADLIATIDHNLRAGASDPRFQRKVMYDNVPRQSAAAFRALSAERAQQLIEAMDQWLSQHDRDRNPAVHGAGRVRVGLGIYYFEETLQQDSEDK